MNYKEVFQALLDGKKLTKKGWGLEKHIYMTEEGAIVDKDGYDYPLDELRECEEYAPQVRWKPKCNDAYYTVSGKGYEVLSLLWVRGASAGGRYEIGNCFRTKEEAEYYSKKRAAWNRFELLARELNEGICKFDQEGTYYSIYIDEYLQVCYCKSSGYANFGNILFKSKNLAHLAIKHTSLEDFDLMFDMTGLIKEDEHAVL